MTKDIVHIYREMRLTFADIEADTPEAAAAFAREKATDEADDIEDCDGEDISALVDLAGDEPELQKFAKSGPTRKMAMAIVRSTYIRRLLSAPSESGSN